MHPELDRYRKQLTGSCCRIPEDAVLKKRISAFLTYHPGYAEIFADLLSATSA